MNTFRQWTNRKAEHGVVVSMMIEVSDDLVFVLLFWTFVAIVKTTNFASISLSQL